jgi:hypothetical protein
MKPGRLLLLSGLLAGAAAFAAPLSAATARNAGLAELGPQLAAARSFARAAGDRLWAGYGEAPFDFLLVGREGEILLCRANPPSGVEQIGRDLATGCPAYARPRSGLPDSLLAAMPLFGPPSTIVMGSPASSGRALPDWLRTILHEHFHQWQAELPDYYQRTAALDLAGGDRTGMWMLNFSFPYDDPAVGLAYAAASVALADALAARGGPAFLTAFDRYLEARREFAARAGTRNWRYVELQLWQEGVARWSEIALGLAYPDAAVRASAAQLERRSVEALRKPDLKAQRRELAYPLGAGEAMLLQHCGPEWRQDYRRSLALGPLLDSARARCARLSHRR